jgi:hypothetical protein
MQGFIMGIISSVIDFVFPIQRTQKLYHSQGRFASNQNQFRSPSLQRRFSRRRLWPNGVPVERVSSAKPYLLPQQTQFRRPLARTIIPVQNPSPRPVIKNDFFSEMFSSDMHLPTQRPVQKKSGFGGKVLNAMRWNNFLFR